jgi:hypothetical protein
MKIINIIKNPYTNNDIALYFNSTPSTSVAPFHIATMKSGIKVLQIEFWLSDKFLKLFWRGYPICIDLDEGTDFDFRRNNIWPEIMEIYESLPSLY